MKLLVLPVTQDEVLHLRAENAHIKMLLSNLTALVANLTGN